MAVGDVIASVASPILNIVGQKMANNANLRIARETNATNKKINDSQLRYQYNQWLRETAYNDPAMQRARLQAAGFSPFSLVNNGNASSMQFSSPIPAQQAAAQKNVFENSGIGDIPKSIFDVISQKEDIEGKRYQNHILGISAADAEERLIREKERHAAELDNIRHKTKNEQATYDKLIDEISFLRQSHEYTLQQQSQEVENSRRTGNYIQKQIEEQTIRNQLLPEQLLAEIKQLNSSAAAQLIVAHSTAELNQWQEKQIASNVAEAARLLPYKIEQYRWDFKRARNDVQIQGLQKQLSRMDVKQRNIALQSLAIQLMVQSEKSSAWINKVLRNVLGIDMSEAASAVGAAAGIVGMSKVLKGSSGSSSSGFSEPTYSR